METVRPQTQSENVSWTIGNMENYVGATVAKVGEGFKWNLVAIEQGDVRREGGPCVRRSCEIYIARTMAVVHEVGKGFGEDCKRGEEPSTVEQWRRDLVIVKATEERLLLEYREGDQVTSVRPLVICAKEKVITGRGDTDNPCRI